MNNSIIEYINQIRSKIQKLELANNEMAKSYMNKLNDIIKENENINAEQHRLNLLDSLIKLDIDIDLNLGSLEDNSPNKEYQYLLSYYNRYLMYMKNSGEIDIDKIKEIRNKLTQKKETDSAFRKFLKEYPLLYNKLEDLFSELFIEFQIKKSIENGTLPDENASDFTSQENYEIKLRAKILEKISTLPENSKERLELENLLQQENFGKDFRDSRMWSLLTGKTLIEIIKPKAELSLVPQKNFKSLVQKFFKKILPYSNNQNKLQLKLQELKHGIPVTKYKYIKLAKNGKIVIPQKLKDKVVEAVLPEGIEFISGFAYCNSLESVILPESAKQIGEEAFRGCTELKSIKCPTSITQIGGYAFYGCKNLKDVEFSPNVTNIGKYAFFGTLSLNDIKLPKNLQVLEEGTFAGYEDDVKSLEDQLTQIVLPENLKKLKRNVFGNRKELKIVEFNHSLQSIGDHAFYNTAVESIKLPENLEEVEEYAFANCKNLKIVQLSHKMRTIKPYTFRDCVQLCDIDIPDGIREIQEDAFKGDESLPYKLKLPNNLLSIAPFAFYGSNCMWDYRNQENPYGYYLSQIKKEKALDRNTNQQITKFQESNIGDEEEIK